MMTDYWIKLYIEILDDPKMATLPDKLWRRTIELFLCAGRLHQNGQLPDTKQLAWMMRIPTDELDLDLRQIAMTGIIEQTQTGWLILKFAKRQAPVTDVERQRYHRDRVHQQQYYDDVTDRSRSVTQITDTDTDTEAESRAIPSKKKRQRTAPASPVGDPPTTPFTIYRDLAHLQVPTAWKEDVANTVTDLDLWATLIKDWIGMGWNKQNIKGMLEAYQKGGIPEKKSGSQSKIDNYNAIVENWAKERGIDG